MNLAKRLGASFILWAWMIPISSSAQKINHMENSKTTGYAPVNGLNMYYEIHGSGTTPLVLIHGGGSTIESSFANILPLFSAHHKVIAVELQAHGRTNDRNAPESFEQDADDLAALLRHLKVDKANILGFSNGGTTTLQIAIRHRDVVNKIIVVAGAYQREGFIPGFFEGMQHASLDNMPEFLKIAYAKVAPDQSQLAVMFSKDKQRMIDFSDIPDNSMQSIKAPALFIIADKDVITVEHTTKMSRLVPGAELVVLPGGHGSYIGEAGSFKAGSKLPAVTVTLVGEFLEK
jgi:pimeloyl-ACP methyl ester carboxylesterase